MAEQESHQTVAQQALLQQVTQYISQYTPEPRIISYAPNASGDVMGRFTSQGRVFTFRLSNKGLVYKPLVQRKDNESDQDYATRFDTGSELWLEHFDAAFKPKTSVKVPAAKKERGTKEKPNCSVVSYHCGVCISLGKNCIKNANTAALKERLQKINSLSRMVAKGQAVPQVKTGVIGAKVDPKSLMKKAQKQAREFAKTQDKAISPKEYEFLIGKKKPTDRDLAELNSRDNQFTTLIAREIYASGDKDLIQKWSGRKKISSGFDTSIQKAILKDHDEFRDKNNVPSGMPMSEWKAQQDKKLVNKSKNTTKTTPEAKKEKSNPFLDSLSQKYGGFKDKDSLTADDYKKAIASGNTAMVTFISSPKAKNSFGVVIVDATNRTDPFYAGVQGKTREEAAQAWFDLGKKEPKSKTNERELTRDRQSAARTAAEPNKTTTLSTSLPLTAQSQKRLERGESISDNETYHVKKEGDKFRVTDPNKFEDKGKLVDKAGLATHMKELEAKPQTVKKSSSMNPVIPVNSNPDTMLRALRDGRLIGDAKQGYEIQNHPTEKGSYLVTTMPNKKGDYSGVMSKKELVSFIKNGGEASAFNKESKANSFLFPKKSGEDLSLSGQLAKGGDFTQKLPTRGEMLKKLEAQTESKPKDDYIPLTSGKNLTPSQKKQSRTADQVAIDRTKSDVSNATKRINTLDDSIKKLKAGKGVMSEADLKKVAALEKQKGEWVAKRDQHRAKLSSLTKAKTVAQPTPVLDLTSLPKRKRAYETHYADKDLSGNDWVDKASDIADKHIKQLQKALSTFKYLNKEDREALGESIDSYKQAKDLFPRYAKMRNKGKVLQDLNLLADRVAEEVEQEARKTKPRSLKIGDNRKALPSRPKREMTSTEAKISSSTPYKAREAKGQTVLKLDRTDATTAQTQILTYITDNSGNLMGICQINGIKYRFLKPVFGETVLTPLSETNLGYLFEMAPDLTLPMCNQSDIGLNSLKKKIAS